MALAHSCFLRTLGAGPLLGTLGGIAFCVVISRIAFLVISCQSPSVSLSTGRSGSYWKGRGLGRAGQVTVWPLIQEEEDWGVGEEI